VQVHNIEHKVIEEQVPSVQAETTQAYVIKPYRYIGEVFSTYVLVERDEKLLLIDKHAAHERIIFEQLKRGLKDASHPSQVLMFPVEVMMTNDEVGIIAEYKDEIEATGFALSTGKNTVFVSAIPSNIKTDAVEDIIMTIADRIKNSTGNIALTKDIIFEKALYQASCKAAIKGGIQYANEHIKWIIDTLMEIPDITVCPHGRPVAMELSKRNVDKQFLRTL
jgi:DNA mismatch repair protein MutL